MGWKGVMRSMVAAARAAERDARRRQRELQARQKTAQKMAALEQAAHEVELYENYIDRITSVHKEIRPPIDWNAALNDARPAEPIRAPNAEALARQRLQTYRPGLFARLFGLGPKKRAALERAVLVEKEKDEEDYLAAASEYQRDLKEWHSQSDLARRVLDNEPKAFAEALKSLGSFAEIEELGSYLEFQVTERGLVSCKVKVHSKDIIPAQAKSLLSTGRLAQKEIPKRRFFELYQDYVCGVVLRVANEILGVLPVERVIVTATDNILDTRTGNMEESPILSAYIPRKTIQKLNVALVDPSDSLVNFVHAMDFNKTRGFHRVTEVEEPL